MLQVSLRLMHWLILHVAGSNITSLCHGLVSCYKMVMENTQHSHLEAHGPTSWTCSLGHILRLLGVIRRIECRVQSLQIDVASAFF
ncbi:unnamed protein product [Lathyrus oleraceus]